MSVRIEHGDCLEVMKRLIADGVTVQSVVTDPPYHLTSIVKRFGKPGSAAAKSSQTGVYNRSARGFMGKVWDGGDIAFRPETWELVYQLLPPGGHLLAFAGTRGYHRMVCAIEDAGFEIRDTIMWAFATGFPKNHAVNRSPMFCQCGEAVRNGENTARERKRDDRNDTAEVLGGDDLLLASAPRSIYTEQDFQADCPQDHDLYDAQSRPAQESDPASFPSQECAQEHNRSSESVDDLSRESSDNPSQVQYKSHPANMDSSLLSSHGPDEQRPHKLESNELDCIYESEIDSAGKDQDHALGFPCCNICGKPIVDGFGTALKPSVELISVARKPLSGTIAQNVQAHGTGAINIDGCRISFDDGEDESPSIKRRTQAKKTGNIGRNNPGGIETHKFATNKNPDEALELYLQDRPGEQLGRWPANLCHDGSDEVIAGFPFSTSGALTAEQQKNGGFKGAKHCYGTAARGGDGEYAANSGSAERFFYCAKATAADRMGSKHPTVKPVNLMRWLVRLVTPPGGTVLDPFAGTGTTGLAAREEGFDAMLIEREAEYIADIKRRLDWVAGAGSPLFEHAEKQNETGP